MPGVDLPDVDLPDVDLPDVDLPDVDLSRPVLMAEPIALKRYVHPALGFGLDLAPGMEIYDKGPDVALVAREAEGSGTSPFRANLTVVAERLHPGTSLEDYVEASLEKQAGMLDDWRLIDRAETTVSGLPAVRTLGHHVYGEFGIVLEQWRVVDGELAWVVAAQCDALEYSAVADVATACAESLELPR